MEAGTVSPIGPTTATELHPESSYDEVPYSSYPYQQSHPNRLAVVGTLFGMTPAPLENCRVLELGCASGGNLIPIAEAFPQASFVGLDYSSRQVKDGIKTIETLGLRNVELRCQSIADVDASLGSFDYIICHGVYSWVPEAIRQKIFDICVGHLNPQGIVYISYNTYPGWHMRGTVREMMLYHVSRWESPEDRVKHARALLDFLARVVPNDKGGYVHLLRTELDRVRTTADNYVLHEHLETVNEPVYFHQFAEAAAAKGLQFIAEAQSGARWMEMLAPDAETIVRHFSRDIIEYEQYLDFLRNRTFRQSLLCHKDVMLNRDLKPRQFQTLYVASPAIPAEPPVHLSPQVETPFRIEDSTVRTASPLVKMVFSTLGLRWPEAMSLDELSAKVLAQFKEHNIPADEPDKLADALARNVIHGFTRGIFQLYASAPKVRAVLDAAPRTSPLVRLQAASGSRVTSLLHASVALNDAERAIVQLADGTHSRDQMLERLLTDVQSGKLKLPLSDGNAKAEASQPQFLAPESLDADQLRATVAQVLDKGLFSLSQLALIQA